MIKSIYFFFFVFACLFGLMACSARPQDKFKNLTADEFDRLIQDENVQRVDVRTVAEYSEGHIPGMHWKTILLLLPKKCSTKTVLWLYTAKADAEAGTPPASLPT